MTLCAFPFFLGGNYLASSRLVTRDPILAHHEWQKDGQGNGELTDVTPLLCILGCLKDYLEVTKVLFKCTNE